MRVCVCMQAYICRGGVERVGVFVIGCVCNVAHNVSFIRCKSIHVSITRAPITYILYVLAPPELLALSKWSVFLIFCKKVMNEQTKYD